ncbi:MAG: hypothetical protein GXN93_04570 [Candidatus Diapherotrites archaeon]|nr:hypothetical protein [Candidatus Diapherotrites archaeon]
MAVADLELLRRALRGEPIALPDNSLTSRAVAAAISDFAKRFREIESKRGQDAALAWASQVASGEENRYLRAWFHGNFRPATALLSHVFSRADRDFAQDCCQAGGKGKYQVDHLPRGFAEGHYE